MFILINLETRETYSQENNIRIGMTGKITDVGSKKPVNATIIFYDRNNKKIGYSKTNITTGHYFFSGLKPGNPYYVRLESNLHSKEECYIIFPKVKSNMIYTKDFSLK
jgi:hypothetical protein